MGTDFQTSTTGRTRIAHTCAWCPEWIEKHVLAVSLSGKCDGTMFRVYMHPECWEAVGRDPCTVDDPDYGCPYQHARGKACHETHHCTSYCESL